MNRERIKKKGRRPEQRSLARGHIRVDAVKAVQKLREHLMLDPHEFVLDALRSAQSYQATAVAIHFDSDELWVTWSMPSLPPREPMGRLLDYALVDSQNEESRALRFLAHAVNGALGSDFRWCDFYMSDPSGCQRYRFDPDLYRAAGEERVVAQELKPPRYMPQQGMMLHLRRRLRFSLLRTALLGSVPEEVQRVVNASRDFGLPVEVNGQKLAHAARAVALRVPLALAGCERAFLEVLRQDLEAPLGPAELSSRIEWLESRVRLLNQRWRPLPGWGEAHGLALRIVVDAKVLPTNASRSALREDCTLLSRLDDAVDEGLQVAARVLFYGAGNDKGSPLEQSSLCHLEEPERRQLLIRWCGRALGALVAQRPLSSSARSLLELPLIKTAAGKLSSLAALSRHAVVYVHRGDRAVDKELSDWMHSVVWLSSKGLFSWEMNEPVLCQLPCADAAPVLERAKEGAARRARLLAFPVGELRLPPAPGRLFVSRFDVSEGPFAGLRACVALRSSRHQVQDPVVHIYHQGRPFSVMRRYFRRAQSSGSGPAILGDAILGTSLEVALQWDEGLTPSFSFDAVMRDANYFAGCRQVLFFAADASDVWLAKQEKLVVAESAEALLEVFLGVLGCLVKAKQKDPLVGVAKRFPALFAAPIWPTTDSAFDEAFDGTDLDTGESAAPQGSRRRISLQQIGALAKKHGALCVVGSSERGQAVDRRAVLALSEEQQWRLRQLLGPGVELVPYRRALFQRGSLERLLSQRRDFVQLRFLRAAALQGAATQDEEILVFSENSGQEFVFAPGGRSGWVSAAHAGVQVEHKCVEAQFSNFSLLVQDNRGYPNASWDALRLAQPDALKNVELNCMQRWLEKYKARASDDPLRPLSYALRTYWVHALAALTREREKLVGGDVPELDPPSGQAEELDERAWRRCLEAMVEDVKALPLLLSLNDEGACQRISVADLEAEYKKKRAAFIPVVRVVDLAVLEGIESTGWRPILLSEEAWDGSLRKIFNRSIRLENATLAERKRKGEQRRWLAEVGKRKMVDTKSLGQLGDPKKRSVQLSLGSSQEVSAAVGAPAGSAGMSTSLLVDVCYLSRPVGRLTYRGYGAAARVNLGRQAYLNRRADPLSAEGRGVVAKVLCLGLEELALCWLREGHAVAGQVAEKVPLFHVPLLQILIGRLQGRDGVFVAAAGREHSKALAAWQGKAAGIRSALGSDKIWPTCGGKLRSIGELERDPQGCIRSVTLAEDERKALFADAKESPFATTLVVDADVGELMVLLLSELKEELRDVTPVYLEYAGVRARGQVLNAPRFTEASEEPRLRVGLDRLGCKSLAGQMELVPASKACVAVRDLQGTWHRWAVESLQDVRVVAAVPALVSERLKKPLLVELEVAAERLKKQLAADVVGLPHYAMRALRKEILLRSAAEKSLEEGWLAAPVWPDIRGTFYSLDELREQAKGPRRRVWFCLAGPPYPQREFGRPFLHLQQEEVRPFRQLLPLSNMDKRLRSELLAEARRGQPEKEKMELAAETRAACLEVVLIRAEGLEAEVGFLCESRVELQGIQLHTTRRFICELAAGEGWPICAVVNDDGIQPGPYFDRIRTVAARREFPLRLRRLAEEALREKWQAPADALASLWAGSSAEGENAAAVDGGVEELGYLGRLWLERPEQRFSEKEGALGNDSLRKLLAAYAAEGSTPGDWLGYWVRRVVWPIDGRLLRPSELGEKIGAAAGEPVVWALQQLGTLLERWSESVEAGSEEADVLVSLRWLELLLRRSMGLTAVLAEHAGLRAIACDGSSVGAAEVAEVLQKGGVIWYAEQTQLKGEQLAKAVRDVVAIGSQLAEKDAAYAGQLWRRMQQSPPWVLCSEDPLVLILREWFGAEVLFQVGGPQHGALMRAWDVWSSPAPEQEASEEQAALAKEFEAPVFDRPWLERVGRGLRGLFGLRSGDAAQAEPVDPAAGVSLGELLRYASSEVKEVKVEERGDSLIRYRKAEGCVAFSASHPVWRSVRAELPEHAANALLASQALGLMNRETNAFNEVEEKRALLALMEWLETLEAQSTETQSTETQSMETQSTETQSTETQSTETQSTETQSTETQSTETQSTETQ